MAMDVMKASPWFIIFCILIIIFGHILNLALGFMGVLVHAVRLNTLEFSNHSSLTWSGSKFKPFKKLEKDNE
jgi:V/A-type H+-transporting ATPase subunit I